MIDFSPILRYNKRKGKKNKKNIDITACFTLDKK